MFLSNLLKVAQTCPNITPVATSGRSGSSNPGFSAFGPDILIWYARLSGFGGRTFCPPQSHHCQAQCLYRETTLVEPRALGR